MKENKPVSQETNDALGKTLTHLATVLGEGLGDEANTIAAKILEDYPATLRDSCGASNMSNVTENEKRAVIYAMVHIASVMCGVKAEPSKERVLN